MRATSFFVLSSYLVLFFGCGGRIAPSGSSGDPGTSSTSGTSTSSGGAGSAGASTTSGGMAHSNPNMPAGGSSGASASTCTVGAYSFCRCEDGAEGTKECLPDRTFAACVCDALPPPPPPCSYPPANNPPGCPASYSHVYQGQPCDTLNLVCTYPGEGDGEANGCAATAGLQCRVAPGGATFWVATQ